MKIAARLLLVLLGSCLGLLVAELGVRILRPDLRALVERPHLESRFRIHSNVPNAGYLRTQPDTLVEHLVFYNSFGGRQHRQFVPEKGDGTIRIGIFGDSFTENNRLPVQYSFTEPLDFLLNQTRKSFEVLNFGVDNYGTDQIYLQMADEAAYLGIDIFVYMYFLNDVHNILRNGLIELSPDGRIRYVLARPPGMALRVARRFYCTYLLLEAWPSLRSTFARSEYDAGALLDLVETRSNRNRAMIELGRSTYLPAQGTALFEALVRDMNRLAKSHSAKFFAVLVPDKSGGGSREEYRRVAEVFRSQGIESLDLPEAFRSQRQPYLDFFFRKDGHWNEQGNLVAAVYLFKFLARRLGLADDSDEFVRTQLTSYYGSFPERIGVSPWLGTAAVPEASAEAIAAKYLSAGRDYARQEGIAAPAPERRLAPGHSSDRVP